ncbi:MAG TPA: UbiD family decarboxylase [Candidatus Binatia bacterium]|jgi:4-hydroxy-3-polyprenylbenzoate decarboxylase
MSLSERVKTEAPPPETYEDLRDWLRIVESMGELKRVNGADWNLEIGTMAELIYRERTGKIPALLFDRIKGYPEGFRILFGQHTSFSRLALAVGLPVDGTGLQLVQRFKEKLGALRPIPPRVVRSGPVLENKMAGDDIDLLKFPAPKIHELDGGRFIGTGCIAITRDPEDGWLNLGTYRAMVHDPKSVGLFMSSVGKHGRMHMEKYFKQGKPCPVVLCVGQDPLLLLAAGNPIELGYSEYDYCGGLRGRPFDLVEGEATGLPFPAHAEIAIEGFLHPKDIKPDGPFGEWLGYYGARADDTPVLRIERVYYRNDPILCVARPGRPPTDYSLAKGMTRAAQLWDRVEKAGLPNVKGVWSLEPGIGSLFTVISIKQAYPGHSRQALVLAAQSMGGAYNGRFTVVVDDDIDPTSQFDVLWAMATRCDPEHAIEIIRRSASGALDVCISRDAKGHNSRALIDACMPYERRHEFPPVAESSEELKAKIREKWKEDIYG